MAKVTYLVLQPIHHGETEKDRRVYKKGEQIALEQEHAAQLLKVGAIEHPDETAKRLAAVSPPPATIEEIDAQIAELQARREALAPPAAKGKKGS
jgi:hypothetical protein